MKQVCLFSSLPAAPVCPAAQLCKTDSMRQFPVSLPHLAKSAIFPSGTIHNRYLHVYSWQCGASALGSGWGGATGSYDGRILGA